MLITINRELGSGGRVIADRLSEKLNIPVYDKEIIIKAAEDSGIALERFEKADEKYSSRFVFSLMSSPFGIPSDNINTFLDDNLFVHTAAALKEIAQNPCIIVGRCCDNVLRAQKPFRVFVYADPSVRTQRIMERMETDEKNAAALVKKLDKQRSTYYNFYTGKTWGDIHSYDLCVNTTDICYVHAADIIAHAAKSRNQN